MSLVTTLYRFLVRGGTAANLSTVNETPLARELIAATDTGNLRLGDGSTAYSGLPTLNPSHPAFKFTSDTGSTADSDPGSGLFKWNHATQSSATFLYFDDNTADTATDLSTYFTSLAGAPTGFIHIVSEIDRAKWQVWKWSAVTDGAGYWKFAVTLQASSASLADNVPVRVAFVALTTDEQVRDVMGTALVAGSNVTITVNDGADTITIASTGGGGGSASAGWQVGYARTVSTTVASTTDTSIPVDTSIPQITEGVAYASLDTTITPTDSASLLEIEVLVTLASQSSAGTPRFALFRDSGANAIAASFVPTLAGGGNASIVIRTVVAAGSTSATTFKLRWCASAGTAQLLQAGSVNYFGAAQVATMIVREIKQ